MALSKIQGAQIETPVDISAVNLTGVTTAAQLNVGTGGTIITTTGIGSVGINTTSPVAYLDIGGNVDNSVQSILSRGLDSNFQLVTRNQSSSNDANEPVSKLELRYQNGDYDIAGFTFLRGFSTNAGSIVATTGGIERVRLDRLGKVGIATTNPQSELHIGIGSFKVGTASTQTFEIQEKNDRIRVGINTSAPQNYSLSVADESSQASIYAFSDKPSSNPVWSGRIVSANTNATSDRSVFLGVYRDAPAIAAHLSDLSSWQNLWINGVSLGGGNYGNVIVPGNVGIGSTTLSHKLTVVGTVNYTDQLRGGPGSFTKTLGQGDIALDRDLYDTPGILFYYDNDHNYGIDSSQAENTGGTGGHLRNAGDTQMLRFIYKLNESGGFTVAGINSESLAAKDYVGFSTLGATMHVRKINEGPIGRHNFFYNSSFAIDLRHEVGPTPATAVGAALTYTVDRWYLYPSGANVTFQRQNTDIIGDTNNYSFDVNGAAGVTYLDFAQRLESIDTSILGGNNVTVSAYVKNTAGITTMRIDLAYANSTDDFSGETYIGQKTVPMSGTTSRISATFENISSFVSRGMSVRFRVYGLTSGVFSIACPQLEIGKVASDWSTVDFATEVNRCARYCQRDGYGVRVANGNWRSGGTTAYVTRNAYTQFRTTPSIHWYLPGNCLVESVAWYSVGAVSLTESSRASQTFYLTSISPSGQSANANATWGNGADVILSAEL